MMPNATPWTLIDAGDALPEGLAIAQERQIPGDRGAVYHAIKASSAGFRAFGEAYFSLVAPGAFKDWKKHTRMTLNLVVPVGHIAFFFSRNPESTADSLLYCAVLGEKRYRRLTVSPGWYMCFSGMSEGINLLLNVADLEHDPGESTRLPEGSGPQLPEVAVIRAKIDEVSWS